MKATAPDRFATRVAAALIGGVSVAVLASPSLATAGIAWLSGSLLTALGFPILWFASLLLLACVVLACGPWGRLRLGRTDEPPEFGTAAWIAMLFAAGMGSGLVFWGVAEPLLHAGQSPLPHAAGAGTALAVTYFHWGLHAWAIYAMAGLAIAWFTWRHGAAETPAGAIDAGYRGALPAHWRRRLGIAGNVLAIVAVVFGVAGALANGTLLLRSGLTRLVGEAGLPLLSGQALILGGLGVAFLASAVSPLRAGIRWLSIVNILLAVVLLAAIGAAADLGAILTALKQGVSGYLRLLPAWSVVPQRVDGTLDWSAGWTLTYLLWWIAWTPFVGIFIARISRGRSLRSYLLGVLVVPVVFSCAWFAVMGGGALAFDAAHEGVLQAEALRDYTQPLFIWIEALAGGPGPRFVLLTALFCLLLFLFLVTSADSAAYVLGMLAEGGAPDPSPRGKLLWGSLTVLLAAGLLLRDSPDVNKSVAIVGAIPYSLLLVMQLGGWVRSFLATLAGERSARKGGRV